MSFDDLPMTRSRALRIAHLSENLTDSVLHYAKKTNGDLPEWLQAKIEKAYQLILEAQEFLQSQNSDLSKGGIFASPAGKSRVAKGLAGLLPEHDVYVEPFCGSAAVFLAKDPAKKTEVINDFNPAMAEAWRILSRLTKAQLETIKKKCWTGNKELFLKLRDSKPSGDLEKLYKFLYCRRFSYGSWDTSFSPGDAGKTSGIPAKLEKNVDRIRGVRVRTGDYKKVVDQYDSPSTVFFFDPPYVGYNSKVHEDTFDEKRFFEVLQKIKGKWLLTYGPRGELPKLLKNAGYKIRPFQTARSLSNAKGASNEKRLPNIITANYDLPRKLNL